MFNANYEQATSYAADAQKDYNQACDYMNGIPSALSLRRQAHRHLRIYRSSHDERDLRTFKSLMKDGLFYCALAANRMNKTRGY